MCTHAGPRGGGVLVNAGSGRAQRTSVRSRHPQTTAHTTGSSVALLKMTVRHGNAGLDRVFGTDVAMTDPVVVEVPGGEAARDVAVDRCDVLAVEADMPDPRGRSREGDAYAGRWLLYVALDSVVLDRRTRATEGRERHVEERAPPRSWATRHVKRYTAKTQTTRTKTSVSRSDPRQLKAPRHCWAASATSCTGIRPWTFDRTQIATTGVVCCRKIQRPLLRA